MEAEHSPLSVNAMGLLATKSLWNEFDKMLRYGADRALPLTSRDILPRMLLGNEQGFTLANPIRQLVARWRHKAMGCLMMVMLAEVWAPWLHDEWQVVELLVGGTLHEGATQGRQSEGCSWGWDLGRISERVLKGINEWNMGLWERVKREKEVYEVECFLQEMSKTKGFNHFFLGFEAWIWWMRFGMHLCF